MKTKDLRIEDLAKKLGVLKGFGCKPEERCCDCPLDNCPCLEYAKMTIELGYEDKEDIKKCTATAILALLKTQAYYPERPNKGMKEMRVVDEDDIENEIKRYTEGK